VYKIFNGVVLLMAGQDKDLLRGVRVRASFCGSVMVRTARRGSIRVKYIFGSPGAVANKCKTLS